MLINDKKSCRDFYGNVRKTLTMQERTEWDRRILSFLVNSELYRRSDLLLTYVSVGSEAGTRELISFALADGKRVAVPVCIGQRMSFFEIESVNNLKKGAFGIPTADKSAKPVQTYDMSALCIVPALSFDRNMNRLGMGGGFYDRYLERLLMPVHTVAVAFDEQIATKIPSELHDICPELVITDRQVIRKESWHELHLPENLCAKANDI